MRTAMTLAFGTATEALAANLGASGAIAACWRVLRALATSRVVAAVSLGGGIYSFVPCPSGRVYGWDPNPVEPKDDVPFFEQDYLLDDWIKAWFDGSLQQPWLIFDPQTRTYRGATIEETRAALAETTD